MGIFRSVDARVTGGEGQQFEVSAVEGKVRATRLLRGLLLFNGVGAVGGGVAMLVTDIGLPLELLDGTPFTDYTIPAWILTVVVGGTSLAAAIAVWKRWRLAGEASILAGAVLLGWIVTEFLMIPQAWIPQLLYFLISLAILWLGWRTQRETQSA
jgi:hypothetical protein